MIEAQRREILGEISAARGWSIVAIVSLAGLIAAGVAGGIRPELWRYFSGAGISCTLIGGASFYRSLSLKHRVARSLSKSARVQQWYLSQWEGIEKASPEQEGGGRDLRGRFFSQVVREVNRGAEVQPLLDHLNKVPAWDANFSDLDQWCQEGLPILAAPFVEQEMEALAFTEEGLFKTWAERQNNLLRQMLQGAYGKPAMLEAIKGVREERRVALEKAKGRSDLTTERVASWLKGPAGDEFDKWETL